MEKMKLYFLAQISYKQSRNVVPRFCTHITDRFQTIQKTIFASKKYVIFSRLPGIIFMNMVISSYYMFSFQFTYCLFPLVKTIIYKDINL